MNTLKTDKMVDVSGNLTKKNASEVFDQLDDWNIGRPLSAMVSVMTLLGLSIIFLNICAMMALKRCSRMSKQIQVFSFSLATSDALMGCLIVLDGLIYITAFKENIFVCSFKHGFIRTLILFSSMIMMSVAVDRFIALHYEMKYLACVTRKRTITLCLCVWVLSIIISISSYSDGFVNYTVCIHEKIVGQAGLIIVGSMTWVTLSVIFVAYIGIAVVIRKHIIDNRRFCRDSTTLVKRSFSTTIKVSALSITFFVLSLPAGVYTISQTVYEEKKPYTHLIYYITGILVVLNSAINPFLYVWRFHECRLRIKQLFFNWNETTKRKLSRQNKAMFAPYLSNTSNTQY